MGSGELGGRCILAVGMTMLGTRGLYQLLVGSINVAAVFVDDVCSCENTRQSNDAAECKVCKPRLVPAEPVQQVNARMYRQAREAKVTSATFGLRGSDSV
jgi:hypothetical protein